jgi:hypothetical protein
MNSGVNVCAPVGRDVVDVYAALGEQFPTSRYGRRSADTSALQTAITSRGNR